MDKLEKNMQSYELSLSTMVPTKFVRYMRTNILWQSIRFVIINIKMLVVVRKSH